MKSRWIPPESPFNLVQRQFYDDPWRLLVACVFCNLTRRTTAEPIMWEFFRRWPTPEAAAKALESDIQELIRPLGLSSRKAHILVRMSREFLQGDWTEPRELYGIGKYANDSWLIFCKGRWREVKPNDHALIWYCDWLKEHYDEIVERDGMSFENT